MRLVAARIAYVVAAITLAACYDVPRPECGFVCGPAATPGGDGTCPSGYICIASDGRCHRVSPPFDEPCPGDAGMPVDLTPPQLTFRSPAPGDTDVPLIAVGIVEIAFSEPVQRLTDFGSFVVEDSMGPIAGEIREEGIDAVGYRYTFRTVDRPFFASTTHTVRLSNQVADFSDNNFIGAEWSFTTRADTTPPTADLVQPTSLTNVPTSTMIQVSFSEAVVGVNLSTFTLTGPNGTVPTDLTTALPVLNATLRPISVLLPNTDYTISLSSSIVDVGGNPLLFTPITFRTASDTVRPMVSFTTPNNGSINVSVIASITTNFNEPISNVNTTTYTLTGPSGMMPGLVTTSTSAATFNPVHQLEPLQTYTFSLSSAIIDAASNPLVPFSASFTTGTDAIAPNVIARFPSIGATNVPVNTTVRADFDEAITNADATTMVVSAGTAVPATVAFQGAPLFRATLTPSTQLAPGVTYTVSLASTLQDTSNNLYGMPPISWTFTTGADTVVPSVVMTSPADDATGVALDAAISVTFDEPVTNVDETSFVVMNAGTGTFASSNGGRTWTFTPDAALAPNTTVTIMLTMAIEDSTGNALVPVTFDFTTAP